MVTRPGHFRRLLCVRVMDPDFRPDILLKYYYLQLIGQSLDTITVHWRYFPDTEYDAFIDQSAHGSIYCYSRWLDTVAPGHWDYCEVRNNEAILAILPFRLNRTNGEVSEISNAPLSQMMGVLLRNSSAKYSKQLSQQNKFMLFLIDQLPKIDNIDLQFHYSLTNWLPFYWKRLNQTTNYTYMLDNLREELIWDGLRTNVRTDIKKARKTLKVRDDLDVDKFIKNVKKNF